MESESLIEWGLEIPRDYESYNGVICNKVTQIYDKWQWRKTKDY